MEQAVELSSYCKWWLFLTSSTERLENSPLDMLQDCREEVLGLVSTAAQLPVGLAAAGRAVVSTADVALELTAANFTNALDVKAERCAGYRENEREVVASRNTPSSLLVRGMQRGLGGVVF